MWSEWFVFAPGGGTALVMLGVPWLGALVLALWLRRVAQRTGFPVYCFLVAAGIGAAAAAWADPLPGLSMLFAGVAVCAGIVWRYGTPWRPGPDVAPAAVRRFFFVGR